MSFEDFEARCRRAVEGMTFFGEPVQDMDANRLLLVIGHFAEENKRLKESLKMTGNHPEIA